MANVDLDRILPVSRRETRRETVLDARICVISGCPLLQRAESGGQQVYRCGGQIFEADVPKEPLDEEIREDPRPQPLVDNNPFLLRILISPESVTPYCGIAEIEYEEELLDLSAEQSVEELFS
jgi:hypothetical protein